MPELPDILLYIHALGPRVVGRRIERVRLVAPFLLRSVGTPHLGGGGPPCRGPRANGQASGVRARGRRLSGRPPDDRGPLPVEAGRRARARQGRSAGARLRARHAGADRSRVHASCLAARRLRARRRCARSTPAGSRCWMPIATPSRPRLRQENHTLKRAMTDPHVLSGIGNAYSDEILHAARLSPFKQTQSLTDEEMRRSLRRDARDAHGVDAAAAGRGRRRRFRRRSRPFAPAWRCTAAIGQPCPVCGTPVQRIVYAANEANYCATCQTGGRLLADRSLSRLLKEDWPRTPRGTGASPDTPGAAARPIRRPLFVRIICPLCPPAMTPDPVPFS